MLRYNRSDLIMIPAKLQLRNFMCYRDNVPPLLLDGVHVACLCGDNGAGKSALLDAITWALWGKTSRSQSDDSLIHVGRDEMEVELEFQVADDLYRVVRKRERGGGSRRAGRSILELHLATGASFLPITGNTLRETQHKIEKLLHLDFETFVNSSFLVQGRADEFTIKSPDKRKQVLAEILGLGYYDALEERCRDQSRKSSNKAAQLESTLADLADEIDKRNDFLLRARQVRGALKETEDQLQSLDNQIQSLRLNKQTLEQKKETVDQLSARINKSEADGKDLKEKEDELTKAIAEDDAVALAGEEIRRGFQQLQEVTSEKDALDSKSATYLDLSQQRTNLERDIDKAREGLEAKQEGQISQVGDLDKQLQAGENAVNDLAEATAKVKSLEDLDKKLASSRAHNDELGSKIASQKTSNEELRRQMTELKISIDNLAGGQGECPLCGTELGVDRCNTLLVDYQKQGSIKRDAFRENEVSIDQLEKQRGFIREDLTKDERRLKSEQPEVLQRIGALEQTRDLSALAAKERPQIIASLAEVERHLKEGLYAMPEKADLSDTITKLETLSFDQDAHKQLISEYNRLLPFQKQHQTLENAQTRLPLNQDQLEKTRNALKNSEDSAKADRAQKSELGKELDGLPELVEDLLSKEATRGSISKEVDSLKKEQGAAERDIERLQEMEEKATSTKTELASANEEQAIYDELRLAFGRRGIQALIIESAIPEIEEEANSLLGRMTDYRMNLKLETQASLRSREGVQETLDIRISDELGSRSYETYSGGEAFRVNVALRIALSRLLARRAGAPLPTLFIDEGFGTQDVSGRDKIIEAIRGIQDDFERIIVITHIDELKEQFPVRIEVQRNSEGSTHWLS